LGEADKLVYPAPVDLGIFALILVVGFSSTLVVAKTLRLLQPKKFDFAHKNKESLLSIAVAVAVFGAAFGIYGFYDKVWVRTTLTADPVYVLRGAIAAAIILIPVIIALKYSKQNLRSIGLTKSNLKKSLVLGLLVSLVLVFVIGILSRFLGGGFFGFPIPMGYQLLSYLIAGFSEEIIFRGYIQSRIAARFGSANGILAGALFYAAYNFPLGFFCFSGNIGLAAVYGALRFAPGLVYGYIFNRTQNVVSSSVVHALLVWGGLLFGLYL
jgi:membrane protease YdiL (CAAX protease family)